MSNYVSQCITPKLGSRHISKVLVPTGGLTAGQVVIADTLASTIAGNIEVYAGTQPATASLGSKAVAIVINDGFETMSDGRRPAGQPNYYKYTYAAGDVAPVVFLDSHLTFEISKDALDSTTADDAAVGKFLYPVNGSNSLTVGNAIPEGTAAGLKIVATHSTPVGTVIGGGFATSFICVAQ